VFFIQREGATVSYAVVGEGPPVVLGHSLFCTGAMWDGVVERLRPRFQFINVDLRGHGGSTAEAPFTVDDLVDDWLAILDREAVDRAVLCGLSTGGMTAMRLALRAPERVLGLALLDTAAGAEPPRARRRYTALGWIYRHLGILPKRALLQTFFSSNTMANRPDLTSAQVELARTFDRSGVGHAMDAVWGRDGVDLSPVKVPTIVLVGEHDMATPLAAARSIAESIEGAELHVIRGAAHLTAVEQPQAVAELLAPFFASCLRGSSS
jgi:3-oxoadipate enol-lactonase